MDSNMIVIILAAVAAISEALALIPSLKSNSILQFIKNSAMFFMGKKK